MTKPFQIANLAHEPWSSVTHDSQVSKLGFSKQFTTTSTVLLRSSFVSLVLSAVRAQYGLEASLVFALFTV